MDDATLYAAVLALLAANLLALLRLIWLAQLKISREDREAQARFDQAVKDHTP